MLCSFSLCIKRPVNQFCSESRLQSFVLNFGGRGNPEVYIWIAIVSLMSEINAVTGSWIRSKIPSKHSSFIIITAVINNSPPDNSWSTVPFVILHEVIGRSWHDPHSLTGCLADNGSVVFGFVSKSLHLFYFWKTFYAGVNHAWEYWCQCLRWSGHW